MQQNLQQAWLGIDIGSVSGKAAVIDEKGNLLDFVYMKNQGIFETIRKIFDGLNLDAHKIIGCGITGSGRNLVKILINADIAKSEIIAHSTATLFYYPNARTIFEIGGEDSKLITVENEILNNFSMNSVCGGGTGAMIENIANRMNVKLDDIGELALKSETELDLPGKCGIFCTSAVVSKLNAGFRKEDILMGVCRALIRNYLTMCAKGKQLKSDFVFQGATALNKALVKALEEEIEHKIIVPEHCALMGAIGIALIAKENAEKTKFNKNFNIEEFRTLSFKCTDCSNRCEVTQIYKTNLLIGAVNTRCGKWETKKREINDEI